MRVGFIHGVMNTDNMTISGETIDYGPCAFMDAYNPGTVFSAIDHMGRYAYANQPIIAEWNLARLTETLLPKLDPNPSHAIALAKDVIGTFPKIYKGKWLNMMRSKLGLFGDQVDDEPLISQLLDWMKTNQADYTNTFRDLSQSEKPSGKHHENSGFRDWYDRWQTRLSQNTEPWSSSLEMMQQTNPIIIPRNHHVETALDKAIDGDLNPFSDLLNALKNPYTNHDCAQYQSPPEPSERVYQTFCGT